MINEIAGLTGNTITPQSELLTDITSEIMVCILQEQLDQSDNEIFVEKTLDRQVLLFQKFKDPECVITYSSTDDMVNDRILEKFIKSILSLCQKYLNKNQVIFKKAFKLNLYQSLVSGNLVYTLEVLKQILDRNFVLNQKSKDLQFIKKFKLEGQDSVYFDDKESISVLVGENLGALATKESIEQLVEYENEIDGTVDMEFIGEDIVVMMYEEKGIVFMRKEGPYFLVKNCRLIEDFKYNKMILLEIDPRDMQIEKELHEEIIQEKKVGFEKEPGVNDLEIKSEVLPGGDGDSGGCKASAKLEKHIYCYTPMEGVSENKGYLTQKAFNMESLEEIILNDKSSEKLTNKRKQQKIRLPKNPLTFVKNSENLSEKYSQSEVGDFGKKTLNYHTKFIKVPANEEQEQAAEEILQAKN